MYSGQQSGEPAENCVEDEESGTEICSGPCKPGFYCNEGSIAPKLCPNGYYCPNGLFLCWLVCFSSRLFLKIGQVLQLLSLRNELSQLALTLKILQRRWRPVHSSTVLKGSIVVQVQR